MLLLVMLWIALGCFTMRWLIYRQEEGTDVLFVVFVLVYFFVPLLFAGVMGA